MTHVAKPRVFCHGNLACVHGDCVVTEVGKNVDGKENVICAILGVK